MKTSCNRCQKKNNNNRKLALLYEYKRSSVAQIVEDTGLNLVSDTGQVGKILNIKKFTILLY